MEVNNSRSMQLQFSFAASFKIWELWGKLLLLKFLVVELMKHGWEGPGLITRHLVSAWKSDSLF